MTQVPLPDDDEINRWSLTKEGDAVRRLILSRNISAQATIAGRKFRKSALGNLVFEGHPSHTDWKKFASLTFREALNRQSEEDVRMAIQSSSKKLLDYYIHPIDMDYNYLRVSYLCGYLVGRTVMGFTPMLSEPAKPRSLDGRANAISGGEVIVIRDVAPNTLDANTLLHILGMVGVDRAIWASMTLQPPSGMVHTGMALIHYLMNLQQNIEATAPCTLR